MQVISGSSLTATLTEGTPSTPLSWVSVYQPLGADNTLVGFPTTLTGSLGASEVISFLPEPTSGSRKLLEAHFLNSSSESVVSEVRLTQGLNETILGRFSLDSKERLVWTSNTDWRVFDAYGSPKLIDVVSLRGDVTDGDLLTSGQGGLVSSGVSTDAGEFGGVPWRRLAVSGSNLSLTLTPGAAGTSTGGALTAQAPDGQVFGGNQRGVNAVDWQTFRISATQVASGFQSTISGGYQNTASGIQSTVAGGLSNNTPGSLSTVAGGNANTASGSRSTVSGGYLNTASAQYTSIPGGTRGLSDHGGELSLSNQTLSFTRGILQQSLLTWSRSITNATPTELSLVGGFMPSGTTLPSLTRLIINDNTAYAFLIRLMGRDGSNNIKWWEFRGCVKRGANAAATAFVGPLTVLTGSDSGTAAGWNASLQASTSVGGLLPFVTGSATTIRWCASGHLTKITAF